MRFCAAATGPTAVAFKNETFLAYSNFVVFDMGFGILILELFSFLYEQEIAIANL